MSSDQPGITIDVRLCGVIGAWACGGETELGGDCTAGLPGPAVKIFPLDAPFPFGKDIRKGGMAGDALLE
jgi:hypothetical protein